MSDRAHDTRPNQQGAENGPRVVGEAQEGQVTPPMKRTLATAFHCLLLATPAGAHFYEGLAAYKRGDYATALRAWRPLAEQGFAPVQYNLGLMYENGRGVPQDDAEARRWYWKAAEQGHAGNARPQVHIADRIVANFHIIFNK